MEGRGRHWMVVLTLLLLFADRGPYLVDGACQKNGYNKRNAKEVLEHFHREVGAKFVGQERARKVVSRELSERMRMDDGEPLVLHFVGPSGTGKSLLAEIVATSIFKPVDCKPLHGNAMKLGSTILSGLTIATQVMSFSNPITGAAMVAGGLAMGYLGGTGMERVSEILCIDGDLWSSWLQTCGIVHRSFIESGDDDVNERESSEAMTSVLEIAAEELLHQSATVIILDDFNFCVGACEKKLKQLLNTNTLTTKDGKTVHASEATIILTSDLTQVGLDIQRSESYENALELVDKAAKEHWGIDSIILTRPVVIPFAPLSDAEVVRVIDKMIEMTGESIKTRIYHALEALEARNIGQVYKWEGEFVCTAQTKQHIADRLHETVGRKNARAITEELNSALRRRVRTPKPIEARLLELDPKPITKKGVVGPIGFIYSQYITLELDDENPANIVRFVIDGESSGSSSQSY